MVRELCPQGHFFSWRACPLLLHKLWTTDVYLFPQTPLFSIARHEKLRAMKLTVFRKIVHILKLFSFFDLRKKSVCSKTMALHTLLLCKTGFSLSIVFHAENMVPLLTFATKLQIAQLLGQALWGWDIFLGLDSPLTWTRVNQVSA